MICRESESGLINCCINGVRESLPFDFELRGASQYGDLVTNHPIFMPLVLNEVTHSVIIL